MYYAFSDGSPVYEVSVALAILVVLSALTAIPPVAKEFDRCVSRLANGLRRTGLVRADALHAELHRLDLLRIVLALLVLDRFWPDFQFAVHVGRGQTAMWSGVGLFLSVALAVGLATPFFALLLSLLLNLIIDNFTTTVSLGSMVVAICMIPLLLAPAGHTLSVDSWLMRRPTIGGAIVRGLYGLWGPPSVDRVHVGRALALVAYAAINLQSAAKHLESPTWTSGATTGLLLLSPIASPTWSPLAEWMYRHATRAYVSFSLFSSYGMLLWQLLLLPLALLSRWTRWFVIVWGVMFFAFSTYVLHLLRLGVYECVLWALVFWNVWKTGPRYRDSIRVLFDDRCNLCDRTVRLLSAVDLFRTVHFLPLSKNAAEASSAGVPSQEIVPDLVGITQSGRILRGYDLYLGLSQLILLLLPLWPILYLGRAIGVGPRIYRLLADRRRDLFGGCKVSTYSPPAIWVTPVLPAWSVMARGISLTFVVLLLAFAVRYRPQADKQYRRLAEWASGLGQAPLVFGLGPVNVFNENDLKVFRNRAIAGLLGPDGRRSRVAFSPAGAVDTALTGRLRLITLAPLFCDQEFARIWFTGLAERIPPSHPYRNGTVFLEFSTWTRPTNQEFAGYQNVPITWETMCVIKARLDDPNRLSTEYLPAAVTRLSVADVDFEPTLRRITLAGRFPCSVERAAAALWYDHPIKTTRTRADRRALRGMFRAEPGPIPCLLAYRRLTQRLGAAEEHSPYLPPTATCESELATAEVYVSEVFDDALRAETMPKLDAARVAQRERQMDSCRVAVGDIRRAYFEAIYGSN